MNKIIPLSLIAVASLYAADVKLAPISVESTLITEVSQNAQVSADLAQALSTSVPSIDMSRRSAIANDIYIRGQKRDNISVEVDGTKICGACPNRMDPPVSHILASQIESVEVIEGPYDVETFGTMSGGVKITTKAPTKEGHGEVNMGFGSWNYKKIGATASGGNDTVRVLISASAESSEQYKDGDGNTMAEQLANDPQAGMSIYAPAYEDMQAYKKKSVMAKAFITITDDQELRLSATSNQSDDVLYPNSKMDAIYDDSNIYSVEYNIDNLSDSYSNIHIQYYHSDVDHPMGTNYRVSGSANYMTSQLETAVDGLKIKNSFDMAGYKVLVGLDASARLWDGVYSKNGITLPDSAMMSSTSIDNSMTTNMAIFAKLNKSYGAFDVAVGARFDSTEITNDDVAQQDNDYTGINANLVTTFNMNKTSKIFLGVGQASRVPDARELYFKQNKPNNAGIKVTGTDTLEQVTNQEIDLGYELSSDMMNFKVKAFYSKLSDYIYYNKSLMKNNFENIDATVSGAELSASIYATDDVTVDMGISYKKGEKDTQTTGQSDTDLADMAPLRGNLAVNYEYMNNSIATMEVQASDAWEDIDSENGEQELDSWNIINLKVKHAVSKNFDFTLGVNNLLDETYAMSNTYADLILITSGGADDVMLMNEPGRYIYTNVNFKF